MGSAKPDAKIQRLPSTTEEKIEFALKLKEEGNNLFRNQEFKKANFKYAKIFLYTQGLPGRPHNNPGEEILEATGAFGDLGIGLGSEEKMREDTERSINDLEATAYANMAQCQLKLGNADKTIQCARKALRLNPLAWKAHWREASARSDLLKDYTGAIKCLDMAIAIVGDGESKAGLMKARARAEVWIKRDNAAALKKQRAAFQSVFNKLAAGEGESENDT